MTSLKTLLKRLLPAGRGLRRPVFGMFHSVKLHLDLASETLIWLGLYERETHCHLQRLAAESASCVDIGAGKGELVCWWLRHFPGQAVVAVEPNPVEVEILHANVAANFPSAPAAVEEACLAVLQRCGYRVEIVNFAWWRAILREHRPLAHNRWLVARRP